MSIYGHPAPAWAPYAALAVAGLLALGYLAGRRRRKPADDGQDRASSGDLLAAAIATAVSADGMWATFGALHMPTWLRAVTFAFIEVNVIQCGRRARDSMRKDRSPGVDGIAMWMLTCLSAVLSVSYEIAKPDTNWSVALVRLIAPPVAAWGWERHMRLERLERRRRLHQRHERHIHWTITPERIAVRLGLAEASERTTPQVDARRRIARVAQAVKTLAVLEQSDAKAWRVARAHRRLNRLMAEANEHAGLARDPELQAELTAEIGSLLGAAGLARLDIPAWWDDKPPARPVLTEEDHEQLAAVPAASDRLMLAVQGYRREVLRGPVNGHRPTSATTPPTTPAAASLTVVDDAADEARANQEFNQGDQGDHAGQGPPPDLASTIRSARAAGMSERQIARRFEIKRHRVRALLNQPASTSGQPAPTMNSAGGS